MTGVVRTLGAVVTAALGVALMCVAPPASAHSAGDNYRTRVVRVTPAVPGLTVTAAADGSYLRVRNTASAPVIVEGYEREPYLRISAAGVEQNTLSPATYLNLELTIGDVPATADPRADPVWEKVSSRPEYIFHDHRIHWMGNGRPAVVDQDPGSPHVIKRWSVPILAGSTRVTVDGTLRWRPVSAHDRYLGYGFLVVGIMGVAAVAVALWRRDRRLSQRLVAAETSRAVPERV